MATPDTTRFVPSRRTVLTGAIASLPAIPVAAVPAVILPRPGLAAALTGHIEALTRTTAPFARLRGAADWSFSICDRASGIGGTLTLTMPSDEVDRDGWPVTKHLEVFHVREGVIDASVFRQGQDGVHAYNLDFPA